MKCENKIDYYCKEKIAINKVNKNKLCDACCLGCFRFEKCGQVCNKLGTELNISQEG